MKNNWVLSTTFIEKTIPCLEGESLLRRHTTVRKAWLSKEAKPTDMLWALCASPDVTDEQLADLADALDEADLFYGPYDRADLLEDMDLCQNDRWECFPDLYDTRHWENAACKRAQQQRAVMRKAIPDAFKISDQDFKIKWEEKHAGE